MAAPSYAALLRGNTHYRNLWLGQLVSFLGDWFKVVALYTIVQQLTDSAQAIAMVVVAKTLPIFLVMPLVGPLIDRFDRRRLLLLADFARAVLVAGLMFAYWLESLPLLFADLVVLVGFTGLFLPTRTAVIPQLTEPEQLPVAMALSAGTWSVMAALGAALGGLGTALVGVQGSLLMDLLSYLLSAVFLLRLPPLPPRQGDLDGGGFVDGLRYLRARPYLAAVVSLKSLMALSHGAIVMIPIYANGLYASTTGPLYLGLIYAVRGVGAMIGTLGMRRVTGDTPRSMQHSIVWGFGLLALAYGVVAWAPNIWWACVGHLVAAIGIGTIWVFASTLGQIGSDNSHRGRVFSLEWGGMTLSTAAVSWGAGLLVDAGGWSPQQVMVASGALALGPMLGWWLVARNSPLDGRPVLRDVA